MSNIKHMTIIGILSLFIFAPLISLFPVFSEDNNSDESFNKALETEEDLNTADVAGTDLYAEQISAYIAGSESIIRQSLFTNDTNIFSHFDANDPAFYKCNVLLSASNGIHPDMFPHILTDNIFGSSFSLSYNSFIGFLYYDNSLSAKDAYGRAERALEIIKRKFQIDLILVNSTQENFYPFVGYYPNWDVYFDEILQNFPMDGYWKALDVDRLKSDDYINNHHLSTTFLLINSLEMFEQGFNISTDQLNFNLDAVDLSYLENLEMEDLLNQMNTVLGGYGDIFGNLTDIFGYTANATASTEELEMLYELMGSFALANDSHYTTFMVQYEGYEEGITKIGANSYSFNLWDALGYKKGALGPSEKIYIALIGAFLSEIDVNILGTDIIDSTPDYFQFSDYMLEQIGLILFYAGQDFDVQALKDYSFELLWVSEDGIFRNYVRPVNLNDENDPVNFLAQFGFQGFPFIPTGLFNPVKDFIVSYKVENTEPNMIITKQLLGDNASYGAYRQFSFNITAENVGNISVWGVPTDIPVDLEALFTVLFPTFGSLIYQQLQIYAKAQGYDSAEEYLGLDETPRIFYFDTWGYGVVDHYYPDMLNGTNLWPYSKAFASELEPGGDFYFILLGIGMTPTQVAELRASFLNEGSVWNDENWYLNPGEKISYLAENYSIANLDTFTAFYQYNFTIKSTFPQLPALIYGNSMDGTNAMMALKNDNESWSIEAEQRTIDMYEIDVNFMFQNNTNIDFENNTFERVAIVLNYTFPAALDTLDLEVYNYSMGTYVDITPYLISTVNNTYTYGFTKYNNSLDWLFDPSAPNDYKVKFRINAKDGNPFNISINDLDVQFLYRDINTQEVLGSRVQYTGISANAQFDRYSNSFTLSTYDMASITSTASITSYSSYDGELNIYTLDFKNIGSDNAYNLNISILIPGIIENANNFTVKNNFLVYNLSILSPSEERTVNFSFYTPNSESIPQFLIAYKNPRKINAGNSSNLYSYPNQIYISAPIDYRTRTPYLRTIDIDYKASDNHPEIGQIFTLTVNVENTGPLGISIPDLNLTMNDQYGDLVRVDKGVLNLTNIGYTQIKSTSITLWKKDWKAYYYPPINFITSSESRTIQIAEAQPIILGSFAFSVEKSLNTTNVEIGDTIKVTTIVKNTGTITAKNITLSDITSFTQVNFALLSGKLVNLIERLDAGEEVVFSYIIEAKTQAVITLEEASIDYYYLVKERDESEEISVKVITPIWIQVLSIIIPTIIAALIVAIFYWQTHKYKASKYELQRSEMMVYDLSSRDSILRIENTLRERLTLISKILEEQGAKKIIIKKEKRTDKEKYINFETDTFCPRCGTMINIQHRICQICDANLKEFEPIGKTDEFTQEMIMTAISVPDPKLRRAAVNELGNTKKSNILGVLNYVFLNDEKDEIRKDALEKIGQIGNPISEYILRKAVRDKNQKIKNEALTSLKNLKKGDKQEKIMTPKEKPIIKPLQKNEVPKPEVKPKTIPKVAPKKADLKKTLEQEGPKYDFDTLYKDNTVKQLLKIAEENHIKIPPKTKKAEIVKMIIFQLEKKRRGAK
ncbi:MAG: HEAT repeat domain-containing protein [Promethearchaeota archaeon]